MKIKKLNENLRLLEDDDLSTIDPKNDSVDEIADAINDEIVELSDGERELPDAVADEAAKVTKDVALKVNVGSVAIVLNDEHYNDTKIENRLSRALDKAYKTAIMNFNDGSKDGSNVLVEGLPGSGKTAVVEAWCREKGLILVPMNATDPKIETAINGMPLRDTTKPDENSVTYAYVKEKLAPLLDPDNAGNCVLFVDEFNRQKTAQLRRPFMSLFNEKRNADGSLDFRKTLLFSVICINPFGPQFHDQGVSEMNPAEINRFAIKRVGKNSIDSNTEDAIKFWTSHTINKLLDLGIISPGSVASKNHGGFVGPTRDLTAAELERAQRYVRVYTLAMQILRHPEFSFSTRDDAEEIYSQKADYVTARMLTEGLVLSQGDVKEFLDWIDEDANFTVDATETFHTILDHYIMDVDALYKRYNLVPNVSNGGGVVAPANATPVNVNNDSEDEDEEDDAVLFGGAANTGKPSIKNAATTEQEINDILDKWF
jgi:hypothetical protein